MNTEQTRTSQAGLNRRLSLSLLPKMMQVQVPNGVGPGMQFQAMTPEGMPFTVAVPPGAGPGSMIQVQAPMAQQQYPPMAQAAPMAQAPPMVQQQYMAPAPQTQVILVQPVAADAIQTQMGSAVTPNTNLAEAVDEHQLIAFSAVRVPRAARRPPLSQPIPFAPRLAVLLHHHLVLLRVPSVPRLLQQGGLLLPRKRVPPLQAVQPRALVLQVGQQPPRASVSSTVSSPSASACHVRAVRAGSSCSTSSASTPRHSSSCRRRSAASTTDARSPSVGRPPPPGRIHPCICAHLPPT